MLTTTAIDLGYNGLTEQVEGLPADAYYDPRQYERELQRIGYRNWVYVGRSSDVVRARAFRTYEWLRAELARV
jgi:phenylpropionate dioxygenase-like ring-hydroxylating dioxygenase large terminal subunit